MSIEVGTNAYATSEEVAAYWADRNDDTFGNADAASQEAGVIAATAYLDANFRWIGRLADCDQLLGWPRIAGHREHFAYFRYGCRDEECCDQPPRDLEGRKLSGIPQRVKDATAELAKLA
jgi:hypothetical protein